jgi:outer membrane receptor protein involved in Fe transport
MKTEIGRFAVNANAVYQTKVYAAADNRLTVPGYAVANGSIDYSPNDRYRVRLWVLNMFDKEYLNTRLETGTGDWQLWAPPRTYGINFYVHLGS